MFWCFDAAVFGVRCDRGPVQSYPVRQSDGAESQSAGSSDTRGGSSGDDGEEVSESSSNSDPEQAFTTSIGLFEQLDWLCV